MRMLRLRAYYDPEQTAGSHLDHDLSEAIAANDIVCVNYTPTPTRGVTKEVYTEYKKPEKKTEYDYDGHMIINRFYMFREGSNPVQRALRYLACNIREYQLCTRVSNIELVYSSSTPPTQGMLSALVAKRLSKKYGRKVPFVFNLQDIFPDSLVNAGLTKEGSPIWRIGRKIESYTYSHADKIIVISDGFKRNIMAKGVSEDKIIVIPNWVDLDAVAPVERQSNLLFDEHRIERSKFVVVYAGNIGEAQGVDVIIDAAKELTTISDIQFVIFGGGARYQDIETRVKKEGIKNIYITNLQPQERVSEVYSMGDIALITCKPGTGNAGMPSKTWSIMACNTPIIAAYDSPSDLADVIMESGAGSCVQPCDALSLAKKIQEFYEARHEQKNRGLSIREYALRKVSRKECVNRYIKTFLDCATETIP